MHPVMLHSRTLQTPRKGAPRKDAPSNDATFQRAPLTGWYSPLLISMANPILTQFGSLGSPWGTQFGGLGPSWGHLGAALGKGIHAKTLFCPFLVTNGTPMDTQKSSLKPQAYHLSLQGYVLYGSFSKPVFGPNSDTPNDPRKILVQGRPTWPKHSK